MKGAHEMRLWSRRAPYGRKVVATAAGLAMLALGTRVATAAGFTSAVVYQVGDGPASVATADFNGDSRLDLVTANIWSGDVSVLLGRGDGTFGEGVRYPAGQAPASVQVADVNGDEADDLVVANADSNDVSILLGDGTGAFTTSRRYHTGYGPRSTALVDLNLDGNVDIAVGNNRADSETLCVLLGAGDGSFTPGACYASPNPARVIAEDLNGDDRPDVIVTAAGYGSITVFMGDGDGTLAPPVSYLIGDNVSSVAAGDVNLDGLPDVLVTGGGSLYVLLGNGDGTFGGPSRYEAGRSPGSAVVADINVDGRPDVVTLNVSGSHVAVLFGDGAGGFAAPCLYASGESPQAMTVADLDADGTFDVVVAAARNELRVMMGAADAPTAPGSVRATAGAGHAVVAWEAPTDTGWNPITSYTVVADPGGASVTTSGEKHSVLMPGLENGTSYTFTVIATNGAGDSPPSLPSEPVTPVSVPSSPTGVEAAAQDRAATVTWAAPAATGGSSITHYRLMASPGGVTVTTDGATRSVAVTGLENGTSYTFTVVAGNGVGDSPPSSPSNAVVPAAPPRQEPPRATVSIQLGIRLILAGRW